MTTWAKLDDDYYDHPKFAQAGPLVELLWVRMLAWSHRNLSDGVVPVRAIKRLCDFLSEVGEILAPEAHDDPFERPRCDELTWHDLISRGIEARLFEPVEDGSSIRVHDYCQKQNTAELVEARREAGRRGGIKSGERRQKWQPNEATSEANGKQPANQTGKPNPSKRQASAQPEVRVQRTEIDNPQTYPLVTSDAEPAVAVGQSVAVAPSPPDPAFACFWEAFPRRNGKRIGKAEAERGWKRMTVGERDQALAAVVHYRAACDADGGPLAQDAHRWLAKKRWEDWATPAEVAPRANGSRSLHLKRAGVLPLGEAVAAALNGTPMALPRGEG